MTSTRTDLGEVIRTYRRYKRQIHSDKPWSQEDLAVAIGSDKSHVNRIEQGHQVPSRRTLIAICGALDIPWDTEQELLLAAGHASNLRFPASAELDRVIACGTQLVEDLEYPAFLFDVIGRLWYRNRLAWAFFEAHRGVRAEELMRVRRGRTHLELLFDEGMGQHTWTFVSEEHILNLMVRFREIAGLWQTTPEYREIVARLLQNSDFAKLWLVSYTLKGGIAFSDQETTSFRHPLLGVCGVEIWLTHLTMDSRFFVSHHIPADENTRLAFQRLHSLPFT